MAVKERQQEHDGIDQPQGEVAAERTDQRGRDLEPAGGRDAQRTSGAQRPDQPEKDFRHPVDRVEDTVFHGSRFVLRHEACLFARR